MSGRLPFNFELPFEVFEKADAVPGKQRRIGGLASVETKDRQNEILLQRGLDFDEFLHNGWFNDNHSKQTTDILGYPEATQYVTKGQALPNGKRAPADGHWVEGYLLDTEKANRVWELAQALQKTNRRLGFSVEGKIQKRTGPNNAVVAKALVRNVAITNCPVNTDAEMDILAKSLRTVEQTDSEVNDIEKTLGMGTATPGVGPVGTQTGMGAGQVLARESLEQGKPRKNLSNKKKKDEEETTKSLTNKQARAWIQARIPQATATQVQRVVELTRRLKDAGKL